jgi:hypothetical protein
MAWIKTHEVACVAAASGVMGFLTGALSCPSWQVILETSQVLAGVVVYPGHAIMADYHWNAWSAPTQLGALMLYCGMSERAASYFFSGLLGMMSFQAVALVVLAVSRRALVALAAPFLVFLTNAYDFGDSHGVSMLNTVHTSSPLGLSFAAAAIALIGLERRKSGLLMLGFAPAVHASIGAWCWMVFGVCMVLWLKEFRTVLTWSSIGCFLLGAALTAASFAVSKGLSLELPDVPADVQKKYLDAWVRHWCIHRQPVPFYSTGVTLTAVSCGICFLWLRRFTEDLSPASRLLLVMLMVSGLLGLAATALTNVPPERLPKIVLQLMPGRFVDMGLLCYAPALIGLASLGGSASPLKGPLLGVAALLLIGRVLVTPWLLATLGPERYSPRFGPWAALILGTGLVVAVRFRRAGRGCAESGDPARHGRLRKSAAVWLAAATGGLAVAIASYAAVRWMKRPERFGDWSNDAVYAKAHEGSGLMITLPSDLDISGIQLRTRRPFLLNIDQMNLIAYIPAAGPDMERVLNRIYGISIVDPPMSFMDSLIPSDWDKERIESRSVEEWRRLRKEFGVTDILTGVEWQLKLPETARNESKRLYHVPGPDEPGDGVP